MIKISDVLGKAKAIPPLLLTEEERGILALYGAAYKVAFERLAPDAVDPGTWPALEAAAHSMREWAASLEDEQLREVYTSAIDDVVERGASVVENTRRAMRMISLYSEIPKPPGGPIAPTEKAVLSGIQADLNEKLAPDRTE